MLTTHEAAAFLKCSPRTLASDRSRKFWKVPYIKLGKRVLYDEAELAKWMKENAQHIQP